MEYNYYEIGTRIRELRKKEKISQEKLIEKLADLNIPIARNRISSIENGERESFSIEFLMGICKIFQCDMGYLLGEYVEKTRNVHEICEKTGLSEIAVEKIIFWNKVDDRRSRWSSYISSILESAEVENLLGDISEIMGSSKLEARAVIKNEPNLAIEQIELGMARLWSVSRTFTDIIEEISKSERIKEGEKYDEKTTKCKR